MHLHLRLLGPPSNPGLGHHPLLFTNMLCVCMYVCDSFPHFIDSKNKNQKQPPET